MTNKMRLSSLLIGMGLGIFLAATFAFADIISGAYTSADSADVTLTRLTISKPAVSTGDFMLANISVNGGTAAIVTPPPGWTQILRTDNDSNVSVISYWKIAGTGEPSTYTWSIDNQTTAKGEIVPYSGVDVSNPIIAASGNIGYGLTATTSTISTTDGSSTVIALYAIDFGKKRVSGDYFSTPSGMIEKYDVSNAPYGPSNAQFEMIQAVPGNTGTKTSTITGNKSRNWADQVIALRSGAPAQWIEVNSNAPWDIRASHKMLSYNGEMWVLSGTDGVSKNYNDVWSSSDGINWDEVQSSAQWNGRVNFAAVTFNGKMWLMGGLANDGYKNDVWSSSDGITWTQETSSAGWDGRQGFAAVSYNNKIWVLGGQNNAGRAHDVWSSTDGVNWTQETASAPWSGREDLSVVVYNNKMWVIGGLANDGYKKDVWSSTDGVNWTEETAQADWDYRIDEEVVAHNNKLWVLGGLDGDGSTLLNDVWSSTDGVDWTEETATAPWGSRSNFASVEYNGKIWISGGESNPNTGLDYNDVWSSAQ